MNLARIQKTIATYYGYEALTVMPKKPLLDLRRIANSQGELAKAKTVLSERKVSVDTLKEEKLFAVEISRPEDEGVLRKSSKVKRSLTG